MFWLKQFQIAGIAWPGHCLIGSCSGLVPFAPCYIHLLGTFVSVLLVEQSVHLYLSGPIQ